MELLVNKKTLNQLGSRMNDTVASKPSGIALRLMEKMGWKEGQGLGKNETGLVKHIVIAKREENLGLGSNTHENLDHVTENWWHSAFSNNLSNMRNKMNLDSDSDENDKSKKKKKKKKSNKEKKDDKIPKMQVTDPPSYDDLFKATGGVRLGMRARREQKGKMLRTEGVNDGVKTVVETVTSTSMATNLSESGKHKFKTTTKTITETLVEEIELPKDKEICNNKIEEEGNDSSKRKRKADDDSEDSSAKKEKKQKKHKKNKKNE